MFGDYIIISRELAVLPKSRNYAGVVKWLITSVFQTVIEGSIPSTCFDS